MGNRESESYTIELSAGELFWLAGALGYQRLPLVSDPYTGWLVEDIAADLRLGHTALEGRGLIHRSGGVWQIDEMLYALVQWLIQPERVVSLEAFAAGTAVRRSALYFLNGEALKVDTLTRGYALTLYKDPAGLQAVLGEFIGLGADLDPSLSVLEVTPDELAQCLAALQFSPPGALPQSLAQVRIAVTATHLNLAEALKVEEQRLLLASSKNLWLGKMNSKKIQLKPIQLTEVIPNLIMESARL